MPPQAVTLEPLVQGEYAVATIRLLGRTEHAHRLQSVTLYWYEISAQGTGPLANISEKIDFTVTLAENHEVLFEFRALAFGDVALLD